MEPLFVLRNTAFVFLFDNLVSNWAYMVMASLAWNLKGVFI